MTSIFALTLIVSVEMINYVDSIDSFSADGALEERFASVGLQVFLLIRHLVKQLLASKNRTWERFFISMDTKMVKKVVPFTEILPARRMIAGEDTSEASSCGISELNLAKIASVW